eukprot:gene22745-biopygen2771
MVICAGTTGFSVATVHSVCVPPCRFSLLHDGCPRRAASPRATDVVTRGSRRCGPERCRPEPYLLMRGSAQPAAAHGGTPASRRSWRHTCQPPLMAAHLPAAAHGGTPQHAHAALTVTAATVPTKSSVTMARALPPPRIEHPPHCAWGGGKRVPFREAIGIHERDNDPLKLPGSAQVFGRGARGNNFLACAQKKCAQLSSSFAGKLARKLEHSQPSPPVKLCGKRGYCAGSAREMCGACAGKVRGQVRGAGHFSSIPTLISKSAGQVRGRGKCGKCGECTGTVRGMRGKRTGLKCVE